MQASEFEGRLPTAPLEFAITKSKTNWANYNELVQDTKNNAPT